jgi:RNA polymerase sigma-70 factor (ECF subfamily)
MQPQDTFEQYRPLLFSIAYRMLGSAMEAEDIVQDSYLRYSQANLDEVQSHKYYLTTIVSRLSLNRLQSAQAQREIHTGNWLPEPILTEQNTLDEPSEQLGKMESISMAFLLLQ